MPGPPTRAPEFQSGPVSPVSLAASAAGHVRQGGAVCFEDWPWGANVPLTMIPWLFRAFPEGSRAAAASTGTANIRRKPSPVCLRRGRVHPNV